MKMKQVLATGAALSMALSMAPVTASAADKVDINVIAAQYGQQTADWWANFVTEFNEANPDINLNVEVVSWNDIYTVVNTRIANGEAPDVLNIDVFADYQADDLLLPIQDVVSEETYSKMYDAFLAQSEVDGTVWAIPDLASARAMYYNKDIARIRSTLLDTKLLMIVLHVAESPCAFCSSNVTFSSPRPSFTASSNPCVAASSASC